MFSENKFVVSARSDRRCSWPCVVTAATRVYFWTTQAEMTRPMTEEERKQFHQTERKSANERVDSRFAGAYTDQQDSTLQIV